MNVIEAKAALLNAAQEIDNDATPSQVGLSATDCRTIAGLIGAIQLDEREACAKIAEGFSDTYLMRDLNAPHRPPSIPGLRTPDMMKEGIAAAIRGQR